MYMLFKGIGGERENSMPPIAQGEAADQQLATSEADVQNRVPGEEDVASSVETAPSMASTPDAESPQTPGFQIPENDTVQQTDFSAVTEMEGDQNIAGSSNTENGFGSTQEVGPVNADDGDTGETQIEGGPVVEGEQPAMPEVSFGDNAQGEEGDGEAGLSDPEGGDEAAPVEGDPSDVRVDKDKDDADTGETVADDSQEGEEEDETDKPSEETEEEQGAPEDPEEKDPGDEQEEEPEDDKESMDAQVQSLVEEMKSSVAEIDGRISELDEKEQQLETQISEVKAERQQAEGEREDLESTIKGIEENPRLAGKILQFNSRAKGKNNNDFQQAA